MPWTPFALFSDDDGKHDTHLLHVQAGREQLDDLPAEHGPLVTEVFGDRRFVASDPLGVVRQVGGSGALGRRDGPDEGDGRVIADFGCQVGVELVAIL